ncbi:MAG: universal stress protein [Sulfitobacter sp.]
MRASISEITERRTNELAEKFYAFADGKIDANRLHWIDVKSDPDKAVTFYSRLFDITILGQYENLIAADELVLHPDRIASESGRPILVAPKAHFATGISEHAVVAWDGRRTASRAFFDAMQLLETKKKVSIVTVGKEGSIPTSSEIDMPTILARHGILADHKYIPFQGSVAETLLGYCTDVEAGLLVMGAYEHSKISEDLFGGVTSSVISNTNIPLFLSH